MDIDVGSGESDDEAVEQYEDNATDEEREGSESDGQELDGGDDSGNDEVHISLFPNERLL